MSIKRLDTVLVELGLVETRSQAENYIKLGMVSVSGKIVTKAGYFVSDKHNIKLAGAGKYVSRAGLKLASIANGFGLDFAGKVVLDVGSSTGGFTDFVLQNGAKKVIAVDVGTDQLHPSLRQDVRVELHEKTDIRSWISDLRSQEDQSKIQALRSEISFVVIDVSFISLKEILPSVSHLASPSTQIIVMVKPQFEAGREQVNKGVVKNDKIRRTILKDFEQWAKNRFVIIDKADSDIAGSKGNVERFYLLKTIQQ